MPKELERTQKTMHSFLQDIAEKFKELTDRHEQLMQQYIGKQFQHSTLRHKLIHRLPVDRTEVTGHSMATLLEQVNSASSVKAPYNIKSKNLEEQVKKLRNSLKKVADNAESLWNFEHHIVIRDKTLKPEDISRMRQPESIVFQQCRAKNWTRIINEIAQRGSIRQLTFNGCSTIEGLISTSLAGNVICEAISGISSLQKLIICNQKVKQRIAL